MWVFLLFFWGTWVFSKNVFMILGVHESPDIFLVVVARFLGVHGLMDIRTGRITCACLCLASRETDEPLASRTDSGELTHYKLLFTLFIYFSSVSLFFVFLHIFKFLKYPKIYIFVWKFYFVWFKKKCSSHIKNIIQGVLQLCSHGFRKMFYDIYRESHML